MQMEQVNTDQIEAELPYILDSPQDQGRLEAIFIRPESEKRVYCEVAYLSPEGGVQGDRWALPREAGEPDPRAQVSLMNARLLKLIAQSDERMQLAGDNLIVDLDLGEANMPVGQKLAVGETVLQVTDLAHTGCKKFAERFGTDAVRYVNASERRSLRLRGLYARILNAGTLRTGDIIRKID